MRAVSFQLIFLLLVNCGFSQSWSEPVIISNGGYNERPDFTIDKSGTIHCVWAHEIKLHFRKIYYSSSTDQGNTWSVPIDISQNSTLWMDEPHIVADSSNNLHVVYDYNTGDYFNTKICYKKYNGNSWSQPVFLSDSMPGACHNRLAIDHNNKVYCFWYYGNIVYRVLEDEIWGSFNRPFSGNYDMFFMNKVIADKQDDLYCIGNHHYEGQTSYDDRLIYFSMVSGQWSNFIEVSDTIAWWGCDFDLEHDGSAAFVWGGHRKDTSEASGTYFSELTLSGMSQPRLLGRDASDQTIAVDLNHQMYIIDNEKTPTDSFQLVYHYLDSTGWGKRILQNNRFGFYNNSLRLFNSSVYLVLNRLDNNDPVSTSILFSKLTIKTGIHDIKRDETVNIYPVPFSDLLTIDLTTTKVTEINILLKDYLGRTVYNIFNGKTIPGNMKFYLNALDKKDQLVPATIYFVSIQMGDKITNQKALYMPDTAGSANYH